MLRLYELGGSSESRREVIPLLALDRRVITVHVRCAGRSEKPPDGFTLPDNTEDLDTLLRALIPDRAVDVIGAALGLGRRRPQVGGLADHARLRQRRVMPDPAVTPAQQAGGSPARTSPSNPSEATIRADPPSHTSTMAKASGRLMQCAKLLCLVELG